MMFVIDGAFTGHPKRQHVFVREPKDLASKSAKQSIARDGTNVACVFADPPQFRQDASDFGALVRDWSFTHFPARSFDCARVRAPLRMTARGDQYDPAPL